jgi:hypothetical protein
VSFAGEKNPVKGCTVTDMVEGGTVLKQWIGSWCAAVGRPGTVLGSTAKEKPKILRRNPDYKFHRCRVVRQQTCTTVSPVAMLA